MWNITITVFTTINSLIKNNNMAIAKRLGMAHVNMEEELVKG